MTNYLVITALGEDRPGIVNELSENILDSGNNIEDSRMTLLGGEFAVILLVSGQWNTLAKLEDSLPRMEEKLGLTIQSKRTESKTSTEQLIPYSVEVIAVDQPGIVHNLASFFSVRNINIQDLTTHRYPAPHTGTPMFSVNIIVDVPAKVSVASLREDFMDFCDDLNLDALIELVKGQA